MNHPIYNQQMKYRSQDKSAANYHQLPHFQALRTKSSSKPNPPHEKEDPPSIAPYGPTTHPNPTSSQIYNDPHKYSGSSLSTALLWHASPQKIHGHARERNEPLRQQKKKERHSVKRETKTDTRRSKKRKTTRKKERERAKRGRRDKTNTTRKSEKERKSKKEREKSRDRIPMEGSELSRARGKAGKKGRTRAPADTHVSWITDANMA